MSTTRTCENHEQAVKNIVALAVLAFAIACSVTACLLYPRYDNVETTGIWALVSGALTYFVVVFCCGWIHVRYYHL